MNIKGVYWGYNPFTNHLLTSWKLNSQRVFVSPEIFSHQKKTKERKDGGVFLPVAVDGVLRGIHDLLNFRGCDIGPFSSSSHTVDGSEIRRENQLRLVVCPMFFRVLYVLYISRGAGFLPSTVPPEVQCLRYVFGRSEYLLNVCVWKPRVVTVDNEDGGCNQPSWKICASQIGSFSQPSRGKKQNSPAIASKIWGSTPT